ncbi:MAG: 3'-5' exonuclease [Prevotella sp.]|nr:3'-5' exonuclease [Prevotella sp.]
MKLKLSKPLIVFDLETTGLDLVKDRIIQIAYVKVYPDGREEHQSYLVNPGKPIPTEITRLTGISDEDVKDAPSFATLSKTLQEDFRGCDFAGFNSNHFDIPMLAEEMLRTGADFDFSKSRLIDVQTIFHRMEPRNLSAAYKFYCHRSMDEDFEAHRADQDAEATYRVLLGQLEMYSGEEVTAEQDVNEYAKKRQIPNDMDALSRFSKTNDNVDFAGRIVWKPVLGKDGRPLKDENGNPIRQEVFNFGKYKGWAVTDVLHRDPGYFSWMMNGDFTYDTKQVMTRIRLRDFNAK